MPLFKNTWDKPSPEPEPLPPSTPGDLPVPTTPRRKRTGLFGSRRSVDDTPPRRNNTYAAGHARRSPSSSSSGSLFSRRQPSDDLPDRPSRGSGKEGRSIATVKQKVAEAENAERLANDALREAVRDARDYARMLEDEALEE